MSLIDDLKQLKQSAVSRINSQDADIEQLRVKLLGKKGELTALLKGMKDVAAENRKAVGEIGNDVRQTITELLTEKKAAEAEAALSKQLEAETIDVTMPGAQSPIGQPHVLQQIIDEIEQHFLGLGFQVIDDTVDSPEVETDEYNFERENLPKDHPARDMQDTFYITPEILLRTQTSPVQSRSLEKHDFSKGPLKMIAPGKVYRRDTDDATHSHQFHQVEGMVVGENITMADLKGTLLSVMQELFGEKHQIRMRPSYFPFTEPSVEVDVSWDEVTPDTKPEDIKWIEVLGAGMTHPNVLRMDGVDPEKYSGFAFGLGPDRLAMLKYGVDDIRQFYLNDVRFLSQFNRKGN
ncbi:MULTISPECIES: phenylalanine--tRNA ligase subunit alpha [Leuconostoc]|uniref:Phenylalanine--tRNA ligase alpha subunit n=1 Tax=Leuconostoc pseudomesenteroides TaxID=33968 RepID=A0A1X0VGE9_LEUPS|nr:MULTISPECIES: phenylalanine--tRNA ligase subunit alpha [Leuconostoc]KDA48912.1 Phenylalanyl-tRNA synthetase alpha chain [Leuconostoc pseudomesenteroides 1159]KDA50889.1 Phenylalanyl-tRNA synthetase alpha chain [Leuconostoc pseudomesenteroides PS12]CCJ67457.1 Phenylalanyl-tRNA synthetase alpha chain [Leuconostoc pseudomesenteroides 4882]MCT4388816.1 phenylalanine--tRNA ligase subunit alpha [Leuconostoc falkenbergense]MCT4419203.1 phenylalanine--tRNA ligase subunit alpha [Leuconostoc falkenbe